MFRKILQYCKREKLIEKGDHVLAGVSGGADSVCMLQLLVMLQKEMEFSLEVIHVEHGIRGDESVQDAVFVYNNVLVRKLTVKMLKLLRWFQLMKLSKLTKQNKLNISSTM